MVELNVQEDETGLVNIQLDFCHICYLALLVLLTLNNKNIFCVSLFTQSEKLRVTSFFNHCLLSSAKDP